MFHHFGLYFYMALPSAMAAHQIKKRSAPGFGCKYFFSDAGASAKSARNENGCRWREKTDIVAEKNRMKGFIEIKSGRFHAVV
jgi:hypothetical protein